MLMFLSLLLAGFLVIAVCAAIMSAVEPSGAPVAEKRIAVESPRFFVGAAAPQTSADGLPIEVVMSQIDRHVRLEQAAAERFLNVPTPDALHRPTASPFVN